MLTVVLTVIRVKRPYNARRYTIFNPKPHTTSVDLQLYHCELVFDEPNNAVVIGSGFYSTGVVNGQ